MRLFTGADDTMTKYLTARHLPVAPRMSRFANDAVRTARPSTGLRPQHSSYTTYARLAQVFTRIYRAWDMTESRSHGAALCPLRSLRKAYPVCALHIGHRSSLRAHAWHTEACPHSSAAVSIGAAKHTEQTLSAVTAYVCSEGLAALAGWTTPTGQMWKRPVSTSSLVRSPRSSHLPLNPCPAAAPAEQPM